jgi:hypothetical protein
MNRLIGVGWAAVLLFDAVAATASRATGFQYVWASAGSFVIYSVLGAFAAANGGIRAAVVVGLWVGVVDATIGESISSAIGPRRSALISDGLSYRVLIAIEVALLAVVVSSIGGLLASRWFRKP